MYQLAIQDCDFLHCMRHQINQEGVQAAKRRAGVSHELDTFLLIIYLGGNIKSDLVHETIEGE